MLEWDGNGWTPRAYTCECEPCYAARSGVCPDCGGTVPTFEELDS